MPSIRPIAICVCRNEGRILVQDLVAPGTGLRFFRPFGGGIEFGEPAADAVRREFGEELGAELLDLRLLGVLENVFIYEGDAGHEIVFVFDGRFADETLYGRDVVRGVESGGENIAGVWLAVDALDSLDATGGPVYPDGLAELLSGRSVST